MDVAELLAKYIGVGAAHVHTNTDGRIRHTDGRVSASQTYTIGQIVEAFAGGGVVGSDSSERFLAIAEHASNPSSPRKLLRDEWVTEELGREQKLIEELRAHYPFGILFGLEASILPDGSLDIPPGLDLDFVLASPHRLPNKLQRVDVAYTELMLQAIKHPQLDILGHPNRHVEGSATIDWTAIFAEAQKRGVAIEINLNIVPRRLHRRRFGPNTLLDHWESWLSALAASGAMIAIGTDIHTWKQWRRFFRQLDTLAENRIPKLSSVHAAIRMLDRYEVDPRRVITTDRQTFTKWLAKPRDKRGSL